jgi:hypothetical protein
MNTQKRSDASQVDARPERPHEKPRTVCPQFRPCDLKGLYPVRGYCVLSRSPGWFMIPSIEEYGRYCSNPGFAQCCWFHGVGETTRVVADPPRERPARAEAWWPPAVGDPHLRGEAD